MVDCSYGLHPWRDMEPEEKLCRQELDLLRDTFMEFEAVTRSTTVPDICDTIFSSDCFGQSADENFDCDELLSSFVAGGEAGALELESTDPLRHDCMWSGLCPADTDTRNILRRSPLTVTPEKEKAEAGCSEAVASLDTASLHSDFDTSDLDESFSDSVPGPVTSAASATTAASVPDTASILDTMYTDHCYTTLSLHTRQGQGSADPSPAPSPVSVSVSDKRVTIRSRAPATKGRAKRGAKEAAKFRFQMRLVAGAGRRQRKTAMKNVFCPAQVKTSQKCEKSVLKESLEDCKDDEKTDDIRHLHNTMERQRRVDLKRAFDCLKVCVPELAESDKASKLMILEKAAHFCQILKRKEISLSAEKDRQKKKQFQLKTKLNLLGKKSSKSLLVQTSRKRFLFSSPA